MLTGQSKTGSGWLLDVARWSLDAAAGGPSCWTVQCFMTGYAVCLLGKYPAWRSIIQYGIYSTASSFSTRRLQYSIPWPYVDGEARLAVHVRCPMACSIHLFVAMMYWAVGQCQTDSGPVPSFIGQIHGQK